MKTLKFIAISALLTIANTVFSHGNESHAPASLMVKEQKAWGIAGDASSAVRTITLNMTDEMRFVPDHFEVGLGEIVRITLENRGAVMHEMVIGTPQTLKEHAELMQRFPGMEHDEPWMAHVAPGGRGEMIWEFNRAGEFEFACLIAGHFQAGMVGTIRVG